MGKKNRRKKASTSTEPVSVATSGSAGSAAPSNDVVLSFYDDHCGDLLTCSNCIKEEPPDVDFSVCTRCNAATYCSKECQRAHWKDHKTRCQKIDDEETKAYGRIPGRVARFHGFFAPMLNERILPIKFAQLKKENGAAAFPTAHVVTLHFSELSQNAKKPRLRLDEVRTLEMVKVPDEYKQNFGDGRSHPPGMFFTIPYIWDVKFSYGLCQGSYKGQGESVYDKNPLLRVPTLSKTLLSLEADIWVNTINNLAEGGRRDLFRAIKEKMKRNRAQR